MCLYVSVSPPPPLSCLTPDLEQHRQRARPRLTRTVSHTRPSFTHATPLPNSISLGVCVCFTLHARVCALCAVRYFSRRLVPDAQTGLLSLSISLAQRAITRTRRSRDSRRPGLSERAPCTVRASRATQRALSIEKSREDERQREAINGTPRIIQIETAGHPDHSRAAGAGARPAVAAMAALCTPPADVRLASAPADVLMATTGDGLTRSAHTP